MPYVNPVDFAFTPADAALLASQVYVPINEQDYFLWPCIVGEKFPPALTTGGTGLASYSSTGPYPSIMLSSNTSSVTQTATWPLLPGLRVGGTTFASRIVTLRLKIALLDYRTPADWPTWTLTWAGFSAEKTSTNQTSCLLQTGGGGGSAAASTPIGSWLDLTMTETPAGHSITLNGTTASDAVPIVGPPNATRLFLTTAGGASGRNIIVHLTQPKVSYT